MNDRDQRVKKYLLDRGVLRANDLAVAEQVALQREESLAQVLLRMELIDPARLQESIVAALGYPLIALENSVIDNELAHSMGEALCRRCLALPVMQDALDGAACV
ncbi:MAG: hypothetical protein ACPGSC_02090, partial [Granulosicoccaceae bacterium]